LSTAGTTILVTRGDDIGVAVGANRAAYDACTEGILRNVSLIACAPHVADAAARLRDLSHINIGLHVCLTCEWDQPRWGPVAPRRAVPHLLAPDGAFYNYPQALHDTRVALDELMIEVAAQLRHLRALGLRVAYLDTHVGVEWLHDYGLRDRLAALATQEGLLYNLPLQRLPLEETPVDNYDYAGRLMQQLAMAPPGAYLVVGHPTYDDAEMRAFVLCGAPRRSGVEIAAERNGQRAMFMRADVLAYCAAHAVAVRRISEL